MKQQNNTNIKKWGILAFVICTIAFLAYNFFLKPVNVTVSRVIKASITETVHGPGLVKARIQTDIGSKIPGIVTAVFVDQGDTVKKGQLLATFDDMDSQTRVASALEAFKMAQQDVETSMANLDKAKADEALARSNYTRELAVFKSGYISQAAMDVAEANLKASQSNVKAAQSALLTRHTAVKKANQDLGYARALLSYTKISALSDGLIIKREKEIGDVVNPGTNLFTMIAPETLWVVARVDETVVGKVKEDNPALIRLRSGGETKGRVARIERRSNPVTRELEVNISFETPLTRFAIDQEAEVTILTGETTGTCVPVEAIIINKQGRRGVMLAKDGKAQFMPIETGASDGRNVIALKGIKTDDLVILYPQVTNGKRIRIQSEA